MVKNDYEIERHRFCELKHFCLQYPLWKKELAEIYEKPGEVENTAVKRADLEYCVKLIETTAMDTDRERWESILLSVTMDISYSRLECDFDKLTYDYLRRKFFWLLSERKGV